MQVQNKDEPYNIKPMIDMQTALLSSVIEL